MPKRVVKARKRRPDWGSLLDDGTHDVRRLDSVVRFSGIPVTFAETTAAHSYWVSFFSLLIHGFLRETGDLLDDLELAGVLQHAITHDLGECVTGDVVRTLKYATPEMKREVDRAEAKLMADLLPTRVLRTSKMATTTASVIVKAADFMSLWQFMRREAARGNMEIIPYYSRMVADLEAASKSVPPWIRGLYEVMASEARAVGADCFGKKASSSRWWRKI